MQNNNYKKIKVINKTAITITSLFLLIICVLIYPNKTNAQLGVPISTAVDYQSVMNFQKNFVLDKVATVVAKQILHQITASVVNWINSGFEGSPLFLSNPGSFFLDVADQVTGAFLATNGPLSSLCSPFAIDIRLALALNQTSMVNQRYECTLGKIIEAQKNGPDIMINGRVINSSQSGFVGGDFNQGGWPAFIALTTESRNNPYGAFLEADADLRAQILNRQNIIRADLQMGQGLLSWSKCKEIPTESLNPQVRETLHSDPSIKITANQDGSQKFQRCEVQTPGSVISGTLQKNLNVPVTELELADDINAVINALVTQLINKMITGGLGSLSSNSGNGPSYTQQIINDSYSGQETQQTLDNLQNNLTTTITQVDSYLALYSRSIDKLNVTQNNLLSAKSCFVSKASQGYSSNRISEIDSIIETQIKPLIAQIKDKQTIGQKEKDKLVSLSLSLAGTGSASSVKEKLNEYNSFVQSGGLYIQQDYENAKRVSDDVDKLTTELNDRAKKFDRECQSIWQY